MNYEGILKKVTTIVSDNVGRDRVDCAPGAKLGDDLGADSLDLVSMVMDVEVELAIEIPDDLVEPIVTVEDLAKAAAQVLGVEVPA